MKLNGDQKLHISIVSPNKQAFSESFIKAHRDLLPFNVHYYYGGKIPTFCHDRDLREGRFDKKAIQFLASKLGSHEKWHIYNLKKSLKENQTSVVLCEYGTAGAEMWRFCKELKIPLVIHFHGFDASTTKVVEHYAEAYAKMFKYSSAVVSVSSVMSDRLVSMGCPPEKIVLNPYGPHDDFLKVNPTYSSRTLFFLGRFVDKKAPYYTILAFHRALNEVKDMRLIMGGDGPLHNSCRNLVRFLGIDDHVEFPGVIDRDTFINYLKDSSVYVQHSVTADNGDMEGTPVAILEASGAGLPVISTRHAGIPAVVVENQTGLLVDEHDVDGMAKNIISLMKDREYAARLGAAGKQFIRKNFSMSRHIDTLASIIETAAGEH